MRRGRSHIEVNFIQQKKWDQAKLIHGSYSSQNNNTEFDTIDSLKTHTAVMLH